MILVDLGLVADRTIDLRRHGIAGPFVGRRAAGMALHASDGRPAAARRGMGGGWWAGGPPVWHCPQAMGVPPRLGGLWWMEVSISALSTNSETVFEPRVTLRLGLPWQLWQSLSAMPSV